MKTEMDMKAQQIAAFALEIRDSVMRKNIDVEQLAYLCDGIKLLLRGCNPPETNSTRYGQILTALRTIYKLSSANSCETIKAIAEDALAEDWL